MRLASPIASLLLLALGLSATAADWAQWRGPARDGISPEQISVVWPAQGPRELWRAEVGVGHSPVCVAAGRLVTLGHTGAGETVWCLDAATGKVQWKYDYADEARLKGEYGKGEFDGPQAAPAIHQGRVFTLSRHGKVHCLDLANGNLVWKRDLHEDLKAAFPECGFSGSPLVLGECVIVNVGEFGTALDVKTGEVRWHSGAKMAGYAAPAPYPSAAEPRVLMIFAAASLFAVEPDKGKVLWSYPWPTRFGANAADPLPVGTGVFITSAYGRFSAVVDAQTGKEQRLIKSYASHCSPPVLHEANLYGFHGYIDYNPKEQALVCLDPATGQERWRQKGMSGQLILASRSLVLALTTGDLVVAEASPNGYKELARARLLQKETCPVPPTLAAGRLYCRSGKGTVLCLDVVPAR